MREKPPELTDIETRLRPTARQVSTRTVWEGTGYRYIVQTDDGQRFERFVLGTRDSDTDAHEWLADVAARARKPRREIDAEGVGRALANLGGSGAR